MIDIIWGYKNNDRVAKALQRLDETKTGTIRKEEFVEMAKHFPILLFPVFEVQDKLRGSGSVRRMWATMTEQRNFRYGNQSVFDILQYDVKYVDSSMDYVLNKMPNINKERVRRMSVRMRQKSFKGKVIILTHFTKLRHVYNIQNMLTYTYIMRVQYILYYCTHIYIFYTLYIKVRSKVRSKTPV